jgi:two-component system sensor histidine kinase UhpB
MSGDEDPRLENERLRALLEAAGASSERERRHWARELHDTTLQGLAAALLSLSATQRSAEPAKIRRVVDDVVGYLGDEIVTLRALIADMRPPALDEHGIVSALEALAERAGRLHGVKIELHVDLPTRLAREVETAIYRTVQEAIERIAKPDDATHARVAVAESAGTVRTAVSADGDAMIARLDLPAVHRRPLE